MASLKAGVVLKLLEDLNNADLNESPDDRKPVLLQIKSIIPVLEKGDLWPNRGFYLKVSDLTHAMYVSLPEEQNEMIMSNRLKLGQFIYVQKLEACHPAPILWGLTPVAARRTCKGAPEDILLVNNPMEFLGTFDAESVVEKGVISEKKLSRGSSDAEVMANKSRKSRVDNEDSTGSFTTLKSGPADEPKLRWNQAAEQGDVENKMDDMFEDMQKGRTSTANHDSDSDNSTASSISSTRLSKRRSWTESEILGVREIFDSLAVKHEKRPVPQARSRSSPASPVRSVRYDSSDDSSSRVRTRRDINSATRVVRTSTKSKAVVEKKSCEEISYATICGAVEGVKEAENKLSWDSLPSNLVKLGKEVLRQRDVAVQAAVEALQEACASQRLIRCLSTYSQFQLPEEDDVQPFVNRFFSIQEDLARTRLIIQSLTNISPIRTLSDVDHSSSGTVKEVLTLAQERNKNAASWIKSALAMDISPPSDSFKTRTSSTTTTTTVVPTNRLKKSKAADTGSSRPKAECIVKRQKNDEFHLVLESKKDDQQLGWSRKVSSQMGPSIDLVGSLQDECQRWFLNNVEKYLDGVETRVALMRSDSERAVMMYNIKRVSDWLDVTCKEGSNLSSYCKENRSLNESEIEACQRMRNKIYGILMKHVERTAKGV